MGIRITGVGKAAGSIVQTNTDLIDAGVDTDDEWVRTRTGIAARRVGTPEETTAALGAEACRMALKHAGRDTVDATIVATITPEMFCPSTAAWVQGDLGIGGAAFDVNAACSGWVYALAVADGMVGSGKGPASALLCGSETFSRFLNYEDRTTAVIFGDGAGAAVVEYVDGPGDVLAYDLGNDPSMADLITIPGGGSRFPASAETLAQRLHAVHMAGQETFRAATKIFVQTTHTTLERAGVDLGDVALVVPHQANARIVDFAAGKLGLDTSRVMLNIDAYGNTSGASIPLALCEAWEQGRLQPGDLVLLVGFGAGMSWASALVRWDLPAPAAPLSPTAATGEEL